LFGKLTWQAIPFDQPIELGAGAFVVAALAVLLLGEETRGRTLESISH